MTPDGPPDRRQSSNAVGRARDAQVLWLLRSHPATAGMLVEVGLFPGKRRALRRLSRLRERGQVRCVGVVSLKDGRPEQVYGAGRWMAKADTLFHEVQITRVLLKTHADEVRRGPGQVDREILPDA